MWPPIPQTLNLRLQQDGVRGGKWCVGYSQQRKTLPLFVRLAEQNKLIQAPIRQVVSAKELTM